jgi:archaellum component FlaF (FlaF/FlaG flagellin family)
MRQQIATRSGTGSSNVLAMDTYISPFNVGFGVYNSGGSSTTVTVQHTFDNPQTVASPNWYNHPTIASTALLTGTGVDGNYAFPVAAIRVTVNSGSGPVTMTVIQAGIA